VSFITFNILINKNTFSEHKCTRLYITQHITSAQTLWHYSYDHPINNEIL